MRLIAFMILIAFGGPAYAQWREASSEHFVVYSQISEKALRGFAENLERYDAVLRFVRGLPASNPGKANRVTVFMVPGQSEMAKLAGGQRFVAGFYVPRAGGRDQQRRIISIGVDMHPQRDHLFDDRERWFDVQ